MNTEERQIAVESATKNYVRTIEELGAITERFVISFADVPGKRIVKVTVEEL